MWHTGAGRRIKDGKQKHMLKEREIERLGLSMTSLTNLLWSVAKTSAYEACESACLSGQTLEMFFMQTDEFQK